ncbi:putative leader peptide [Streptomyces sp. NPDC088194]
MRETSARSVATYSRRHIDLQRVAGAMCPGAPGAMAGPYAASLPRTVG